MAAPATFAVYRETPQEDRRVLLDRCGATLARAGKIEVLVEKSQLED